MAVVTDELVSFLLTWLLLWAALCLIYAALLVALDYLLGLWQRRQLLKRQRRAHLAELARIEQQTNAAVHRISAAFLVAQQLVCADATGKGERRS